MLIIILQLSALFLLIIASISFAWVHFLNHALASRTISRKWQEKSIGRTKAKSWGRIYESVTYQPIAGAAVKLFDAKNKKLLAQTLSDRDGYFGFEVPEGKFYLRLNSFYHTFPSVNLMKKLNPSLLERRKNDNEYYGLFLPQINDGPFENIYFGEVINNSSRNLQQIFARHNKALEKIEAKTPILINIPLDRTEVLTLDSQTLKSVDKQSETLAKVKWGSLVTGLAAIIASYILKLNFFSLIVISLFVIFSLAIIIGKMRKKMRGTITNLRGEKLQNTLIRARGYRSKEIKATAISNILGEFELPLNYGWYSVEIGREDYQPEKQLVQFESDDKRVDYKLKRILP